ncbi:MAG TPA: hypothetical protein VHO72_11800, partial [Bacteroidales bacterium]|nr:hypothetical protein [Bacteroidales bacterium]
MKIVDNGLKLIRRKLLSIKVTAKIIFFVTGIASTIWFLARVIPKPSRAGYPCMKAAAPVMSGFILWLLSLTGLTISFKKAVKAAKESRYLIATAFGVSGIVLLLLFYLNDARNIYAHSMLVNTELPDKPNSPMGKSYGIFPGRVVWAYNRSATNDTCPNTPNDAYYLPTNNNQDTINKMADDAVKSLSGKKTVKEAWDAIIKDFNLRKTGKAKGYADGQTFFFKINNGQAGWAINMRTLAESRTRVPISGTTPSSVVAFIRQLVDSCNVPQEKIIIGE